IGGRIEVYEFGYHRPSSVSEAVALLRGAEDPKVMSGGQTLIPTLKQRLAQPSDVVDLGGIADLVGVREDGGTIVIGGMTTHAAVASSALVRGRIPGLASLAEGIGDPQVRNRGTIGGSIANNDPASDYPGAVLALDAVVETDRRELGADGFFTGMFETALEADELVTAVRFPVPEKSAYAKFPNPASRYAVVGVMVAVTGGGVRVAVTGAGAVAYRWSEAEAALGGGLDAASLDGLTVDPSALNADLHASAAYRAHLVKVMATRAVQALV
ncbi:MAG: xanthine dehydrogenase family protein subunit M, partial [Pseudomonadota bacterium]